MVNKNDTSSVLKIYFKLYGGKHYKELPTSLEDIAQFPLRFPTGV